MLTDEFLKIQLGGGRLYRMHDAAYYREQAERARRLAKYADGDMQTALESAARDFDDIAEDLESGAIEIRHPDMPQNRR